MANVTKYFGITFKVMPASSMRRDAACDYPFFHSLKYGDAVAEKKRVRRLFQRR